MILREHKKILPRWALEVLDVGKGVLFLFDPLPPQKGHFPKTTGLSGLSLVSLALSRISSMAVVLGNLFVVTF